MDLKSLHLGFMVDWLELLYNMNTQAVSLVMEWGKQVKGSIV